MSWSLAGQEDYDRIEAFLAARAASSMFLRAGLRDSREQAEPPNRFWIFERGDDIGAVVSRRNPGFLLMQGDDWSPEVTAGLNEALAGEKLIAVNGAADQCAPVCAALGLGDDLIRMWKDEPLCHLDLADLQVPEGPGALRPLAASDGFLNGWRADYLAETGTGPEDSGAMQVMAAEQIADYLRADSHRLLSAGDRPLAMTGFNARLPDIVQIGGVYTPPDLRGQGHARRALALHLAEARSEGVSQSVLFAASEPALRAYYAIGYQLIGSYALIFLHQPVRIGEGPC